MGTLGKAAGVSGAFVAGDRRVIEAADAAGACIFTTASSPILAAALLASLEFIAAGDERRARLQCLISRLQQGLSGLPWRLLPSQTAIQPLLIGGNDVCDNWRNGCSHEGRGRRPSVRRPCPRTPPVCGFPCRRRMANLRLTISSPPSMTAPITAFSPPAALPAKQRIRQAFDQAATGYDAAADVQREVSDRLAAHLLQAGLWGTRRHSGRRWHRLQRALAGPTLATGQTCLRL